MDDDLLKMALDVMIENCNLDAINKLRHLLVRT